MKPYPSTKELRDVFDYVDGCLYWKIKPCMAISIGDKAGTNKGAEGYARVMYKRSTYLIHRIVWVWHGNSLNENLEIDHINRNRSDNRIENLRQVSKAKNLENQKGNMVCYCPSIKSKKKWKAYTKQTSTNRQVHLGYYETKEDALQALKNNERRCSVK